MRKACSRCGVERPEEDFNKRARSKDGLRAECRECQRADAKAYGAAHAPEIAARSRAWRSKNVQKYRQGLADYYARTKDRDAERKRRVRAANPELTKAKDKARNERHRDKRLALMREWYARNKEAHLARTKARYEADKPSHFEKAYRRRAAKLAATIQPFTQAQLEARMSVFGNRCAYCGGAFENIDHVKPLSRGGPHCLANLRPACEHCNKTKWATPLKEWLSRTNM